MRFYRCLTVFLFTVLLLSIIIVPTLAQTVPIPSECGQIITAEFLENRDVHEYALDFLPGDILDITVEYIGEGADINLWLISPAGNNVSSVDPGGAAPVLNDFEIGSTGTFIVHLQGYHAGAYRVSFGCVLNGVSINPGDVITNDPNLTQNSSQTSQFSGIGFPGLPSVNMESVARIPMLISTPITGAVTQTGNEILAYTFEVDAGVPVDVSFTKLSGNLNIGMVILSPDNQVVFQASLITSETLATRLTLPSNGQYIVGVFRVDITPPLVPEPTAFQVTVSPVE